MNTLLEAPAHEAETADLRHDGAGVIRKANGSPPNHACSGLRWLKATVQTIDSRRDRLERKRWKKVWRSMGED
jgi:hypothetical protein